MDFKSRIRQTIAAADFDQKGPYSAIEEKTQATTHTACSLPCSNWTSYHNQHFSRSSICKRHPDLGKEANI